MPPAPPPPFRPRAPEPSPYQVLGVPLDATPGQIQRAFRAKAKQLHPDVSRSPSAAEEFARLQAAYEVLSDPDRRRKFDHPVASPPASPPGPARYTWSNIAGRPGAGRATAGDDPDAGFEEMYRAFFQTRLSPVPPAKESATGVKSARPRRSGPGSKPAR
ncbi:MAG: DnaJ domain-containing protein [Phycisphaerales bacterium]